jgi:hypothetical protein
VTSATAAVGPRMAVAMLLAAALVAPGLAAVGADTELGPFAVTLERIDGTRLTGALESVDRDGVRLLVDGAAQRLPVSEVRTITRVAAAATAAAAVRVMGSDGSTVTGDDFAWSAAGTLITCGDDRIEMPADRVRLAVWSAATATGDPEWMAAVPAEPQADVVVVSRGEGFELVECAIEAVAADTVTVVLDGERIPVKRAKVLGLVWVRPAADAASGTRVAIDGGSLTATTVEWSPAGLVLDAAVRLPASVVTSIDFAAGRTVSLVALETEKVTVEPFFGGLATVDGMARFFAPRPVPAPSGDGRSLLVRPRSTAVWRVPADSRRFRATLVRAAAVKSAAAVRVVLRADERTVWEGTLDATTAEAAIDVDLSAARRLAIEADFVAGGMGCPVRFDAAVFEK